MREGRRKEFASFPQFADAAVRERIPRPDGGEQLEASKLDWEAREDPTHRDALAETRRLLTLRRQDITPRLRGMTGHSGRIEWIEV